MRKESVAPKPWRTVSGRGGMAGQQPRFLSPPNRGGRGGMAGQQPSQSAKRGGRHPGARRGRGGGGVGPPKAKLSKCAHCGVEHDRGELTREQSRLRTILCATCAPCAVKVPSNLAKDAMSALTLGGTFPVPEGPHSPAPLLGGAGAMVRDFARTRCKLQNLVVIGPAPATIMGNGMHFKLWPVGGLSDVRDRCKFDFFEPNAQQTKCACDELVCPCLSARDGTPRDVILFDARIEAHEIDALLNPVVPRGIKAERRVIACGFRCPGALGVLPDGSQWWTTGPPDHPKRHLAYSGEIGSLERVQALELTSYLSWVPGATFPRAELYARGGPFEPPAGDHQAVLSYRADLGTAEFHGLSVVRQQYELSKAARGRARGEAGFHFYEVEGGEWFRIISYTKASGFATPSRSSPGCYPTGIVDGRITGRLGTISDENIWTQHLPPNFTFGGHLFSEVSHIEGGVILCDGKDHYCWLPFPLVEAASNFGAGRERTMDLLMQVVSNLRTDAALANLWADGEVLIACAVVGLLKDQNHNFAANNAPPAGWFSYLWQYTSRMIWGSSE